MRDSIPTSVISILQVRLSFPASLIFTSLQLRK